VAKKHWCWLLLLVPWKTDSWGHNRDIFHHNVFVLRCRFKQNPLWKSITNFPQSNVCSPSSFIHLCDYYSTCILFSLIFLCFLCICMCVYTFYFNVEHALPWPKVASLFWFKLMHQQDAEWCCDVMWCFVKLSRVLVCALLVTWALSTFCCL